MAALKKLITAKQKKKHSSLTLSIPFYYPSPSAASQSERVQASHHIPQNSYTVRHYAQSFVFYIRRIYVNKCMYVRICICQFIIQLKKIYLLHTIVVKTIIYYWQVCMCVEESRCLAHDALFWKSSALTSCHTHISQPRVVDDIHLICVCPTPPHLPLFLDMRAQDD